MLCTFQATNQCLARLTSNTTLSNLKTLIDKLPFGTFWYEITSGAAKLYTNNGVEKNSVLLVFKRNAGSNIVILFPYGGSTIYVMYKYGEEWTDFYMYGSEIFAPIVNP